MSQLITPARTLDTEHPLRVGIMLSGGGRTLQNFLDQQSAGTLPIEIPLVIASSENCGGIARAEAADIPCEIVNRKKFASLAEFSERNFSLLREANVDLVALAGYLCLLDIPEDFTLKVLNIHPSLIPAFCGKGFYGHHVHEAVVKRGVKVSGCTVHFADPVYDHGPIVLQETVPVFADDDADSVAARVFEAECFAFPEALRLFAAGRLELHNGRIRISEAIV